MGKQQKAQPKVGQGKGRPVVAVMIGVPEGQSKGKSMPKGTPKKCQK